MKSPCGQHFSRFLTLLAQVCWIPIFKTKKLILAGDPMQLPPTVISMDNKKKDKSTTSQSSQAVTKAGSKSSKGDTKSSTAKEVVKDLPANPETESSDEDASGASGDEDDSGLTADPEAPPKVPVKDPRKTGPKPILRPPRSLETTLFERLEKMYGPGIKRMLTVQYRCAIGRALSSWH